MFPFGEGLTWINVNYDEVLYSKNEIWYTPKFICKIYEISESELKKYISDIYKSGKLDSEVTHFEIVQESENKIVDSIEYYNIDVILCLYDVFYVDGGNNDLINKALKRLILSFRKDYLEIIKEIL